MWAGHVRLCSRVMERLRVKKLGADKLRQPANPPASRLQGCRQSKPCRARPHSLLCCPGGRRREACAAREPAHQRREVQRQGVGALDSGPHRQAGSPRRAVPTCKILFVMTAARLGAAAGWLRASRAISVSAKMLRRSEVSRSHTNAWKSASREACGSISCPKWLCK